MYTWAKNNGYECSSAGDSKFSAFYAIMPDGRSIEQHYQCDVKGYEVGGTNWKLGKGKPPLKDVDLWKEYLNLWKIWAKTNSHLLDELEVLAGERDCVLSDMFAKTDVNQAHALCVILNDRFYSRYAV